MWDLKTRDDVCGFQRACSALHWHQQLSTAHGSTPVPWLQETVEQLKQLLAVPLLPCIFIITVRACLIVSFLQAIRFWATVFRSAFPTATRNVVIQCFQAVGLVRSGEEEVDSAYEEALEDPSQAIEPWTSKISAVRFNVRRRTTWAGPYHSGIVVQLGAKEPRAAKPRKEPGSKKRSRAVKPDETERMVRGGQRLRLRSSFWAAGRDRQLFERYV